MFSSKEKYEHLQQNIVDDFERAVKNNGWEAGYKKYYQENKDEIEKATYKALEENKSIYTFKENKKNKW